MNNITKTIEEGKKEFDEKFLAGSMDECITIIPNDKSGSSAPLYTTRRSQIKSHIASQNKKLLEAVVGDIEEKINSMKPESFHSDYNVGRKAALSDIKQFLTETLKEL